MFSKKLVVLRLLLLTVFFVSCAFAELPESSLYQGRSHYTVNMGDGDILNGYIDFAVYDTEAEGGDGFSKAGYDAPGDGQYVYAYQIFNNASNGWGLNNLPVDYFSVFGLGDNAIGIDLETDGVDAIDDNTDGVDTDFQRFGDNKAVWEFDEGTLYGGEHSFMLVMTSDSSYTWGEYSLVRTDDNSTIVPGGGTSANSNSSELLAYSIPEPSTMALLSFATAVFLRKRKKNSI